MVYEKNYVLYKKSDFLGQKKSLSLSYDTDMKIDVYSESATSKNKIATFTVKGIDNVATNEVSKLNTTGSPKVSLNFELTRSGFIQLNKAEAKVEETYTIEERVPTPKKNKTLKVQKQNDTSPSEDNSNADNSTDSVSNSTSDDANSS